MRALERPPRSRSEQEAERRENDPDGWWACDRPEHPHVDTVTCYHDCCRACTIAAQVVDVAVAKKMMVRLEEHGEAAP